MDSVVNRTSLLSLVLADGDQTRFPQVKVYDDAGNLEDTVNLSHVADGMYQGTWEPNTKGTYSCNYITYTDSNHTTEGNYDRVSESWFIIEPAEYGGFTGAGGRSVSAKDVWEYKPKDLDHSVLEELKSKSVFDSEEDEVIVGKMEFKIPLLQEITKNIKELKMIVQKDTTSGILEEIKKASKRNGLAARLIGGEMMKIDSNIKGNKKVLSKELDQKTKELIKKIDSLPEPIDYAGRFNDIQNLINGAVIGIGNVAKKLTEIETIRGDIKENVGTSSSEIQTALKSLENCIRLDLSLIDKNSADAQLVASMMRTENHEDVIALVGGVDSKLSDTMNAIDKENTRKLKIILSRFEKGISELTKKLAESNLGDSKKLMSLLNSIKNKINTTSEEMDSILNKI